MKCSELAAKLTESYYTTDTYDATNSSNESLNEYMNYNGILLTMCIAIPFFPKIFGGPCKLGIRENHISASWIRSTDTGFRIYGSFPIGLVLNPVKTRIDCIYPVNALTDSRFYSGCGPLPEATDAPINLKRIKMKIEIINYKSQKFGQHTNWTDIDCNDFMHPLLVPGITGNFAMNNSECPTTVNGGIPFHFEIGAEYIYNGWSNIMGHPVCNVSHPWPDPTFKPTDAISYVGSCLWKPNDWVGMIDTMEQIALVHPKVHFWNEIVVAKPKMSVEELVLAVFVMEGSSSARYEIARFEAQKIGKPLLVLHHESDHNVSFTCDEQSAVQ